MNHTCSVIKYVLQVWVPLALFGCRIWNPVITEAPQSIRETAWTEAHRYIGMEYEWGGQDFPPRGIDCSGLVVNVYRTILQGSGYGLLFADAAVRDLYASYSRPIDNPEVGDLIFMGEAASNEITHVAICGEQEDEMVRFIDATQVEGLSVNGVSCRSHPLGDPRMKAFGRLLLRVY